MKNIANFAKMRKNRFFCNTGSYSYLKIFRLRSFYFICFFFSTSPFAGQPCKDSLRESEQDCNRGTATKEQPGQNAGKVLLGQDGMRG
jgi:hypothetical protein